MGYWLLKSEPSAYAWEQLVKDGRTHWNGVRNYQAANNLKAMKRGDRAFFYHSNEGSRSSASPRSPRRPIPTRATRRGASSWSM